jgi:hypothetical protein
MLFSDMLIAAVESGVYTSGNHAQVWTEIGDIPAPPSCLAVRGRATGTIEGTLMAGTSKGVYLYSRPSLVRGRQTPEYSSDNLRPSMGTDGTVVLLLPAGYDRPAEIAVYTPGGKAVARIYTVQPAVRLRLPSQGLYYYTCRFPGTARPLSGMVVTLR